MIFNVSANKTGRAHCKQCIRPFYTFFTIKGDLDEGNDPIAHFWWNVHKLLHTERLNM